MYKCLPPVLLNIRGKAVPRSQAGQAAPHLSCTLTWHIGGIVPRRWCLGGPLAPSTGGVTGNWTLGAPFTNDCKVSRQRETRAERRMVPPLPWRCRLLTGDDRKAPHTHSAGSHIAAWYPLLLCEAPT